MRRAAAQPVTGLTTAARRAATATRRSRRSTATTCGKLTLAWEFKTGEAGIETGNSTALEATPLVVDGVMYLSTPLGKVVGARSRHRQASAGRAMLTRQAQAALRRLGEPRRVVLARSLEEEAARLRAAHLSSASSTRGWWRWTRPNGKSCEGFGKGGERQSARAAAAQQTILRRRIRADLAARRRRRPHRRRLRRRRQQLDRGRERRSPRFDARTGALRWTWNPVPQDPDDPAYKTWAARRRIAPAAPTPGPSSPPIPSATWCSCPPRARRSTTTASRGSATTATPIPSSRCAPRPEKWSGISRPCITICGTTTMPRRRR